MPIRSKVHEAYNVQNQKVTKEISAPFGMIPNDYEMHSSQKNGLGMYVNHRITIDSYYLLFVNDK